ncbi:hypothetical protein CHLRE_16g678885v5 [Chlamydomonas reinhardtii]|uniref:Uncharacterized protein n=1 Tax=Chlamydomonas reinhardtii TaxID=3055 RepID=A0A2K3CVX4_CHLRE|nr:uncharacterized protein CHLRE_16g678885v5 [Chlamydomonas reinhardtii]PNW72429.1 hypothetical protein CHLRE_16g678885v5 [Chlamydomonas reinhardtii]
MDIPLHTYYRDPRQVRERQRLWAALVSYRVQQERTELERRHIQLSNAQQQELQQEQER